MRLSTIAIALAMVGCALPPPPVASGDDDEDQVDAGTGEDDDDEEEIDAGPRPDSRGPEARELSQSTSDLLVIDNSITCFNDDGSTAQTSFWRTFDLSDEGVSGDFDVDAVEFGVEYADNNNGGNQTVQVKLHTVSGTFATQNLTELATASVSVSQVTLALLRAEFNAVKVPAGSTLAIEIRLPNGDNGNKQLMPGSNPGGQTGPSYISAPECNDLQPRDLASIGYPNMHLVMTVLGEG